MTSKTTGTYVQNNANELVALAPTVRVDA